MSHLTEADIELFLNGRLKAAETRRVIRHLLTDCDSCHADMAARAVPLLELPEQGSPGAALGEALYDEAFDRAVSGLRWRTSRWQQERARREELMTLAPETLLELSGGTRRKRRRDWALVEVLLAASHEARFRNPGQMRTFAAAAVTVARSLDTAWYGPALCKNLQRLEWEPRLRFGGVTG